MAMYTMSTSLVQRSKGSSAVAHAAYVSGQRLINERTGQESDYTRRRGVECVAPLIVVPAQERGTQSAMLERGQLWSMAELAEKRKDGTPARSIVIGLPSELDPVQRHELVLAYAQWIADRHGVAVDYALHLPDKKGDQRNFHAHLSMTTRQVKDGQLTEKSQLEWNRGKLKEAGLPDAKEMLQELRQQWEEKQNRALQIHAPKTAPVSCRSLAAQREEALEIAEDLKKEGNEDQAKFAELQAVELERTPQQHVGWKATAMERRGIQTERGEQRRQAQEEHKERLSLIKKIWNLHRELVAVVKQAAEDMRLRMEAKKQLKAVMEELDRKALKIAEKERWLQRRVEGLMREGKRNEAAWEQDLHSHNLRIERAEIDRERKAQGEGKTALTLSAQEYRRLLEQESPGVEYAINKGEEQRILGGDIVLGARLDGRWGQSFYAIMDLEDKPAFLQHLEKRKQEDEREAARPERHKSIDKDKGRDFSR